MGEFNVVSLLEKTKKLDAKTTIRKHVEVVKRPMHLIQLNKGLNLRQQRFFNLAILNVKDGVSEISKAQYNELFSDDTDHFYSASVVEDIQKLIGLNIQTETEYKMIWDTVFLRVEYDKKEKVYRFKWSPYMKERIEDVQRNYIQQDLKTLARFCNKYSFIWYDYFKSNHRQWKWILSKEETMQLLRTEDKKTYVEHHAVFFKQCIEIPIKEINTHTEYHITVTPIKEGRAIVGYEFRRETTQGIELSVTPNQLGTLQEIVDRYGDTPLMMREIMDLGIYDAEAARDLSNLFFEIQTFKNHIASADTFTSESFKEIVALAIQKDNAFKSRWRSIKQHMQDKSIIDVFIEKQPNNPKSEFYNWLDERE